jgi:hypothetical protein
MTRCGRLTGTSLSALILVSCSAPLNGWEDSSVHYSSGLASCTSSPHRADLDLVAWTSFTAPGAATPAEWCRAVGPVFLTDHAGLPGGAVDGLVVATWNVRVGAGDLQEFVSDLRRGALTGQPEPSFVLLLQEAYRVGAEVPLSESRLTSRIEIAPPSGERMDVVELASRLGLHAFYVPSMPNGVAEADGSQPEDRGNAVISTVPLRGLAAIELPFEAQRRVAVVATVAGSTSDGTPWSLRVASGHLDTRSRWSRFLDSFGAGRARQARALERGVTGDTVVLGADLNSWSPGFLEGALDVLYDRFPDTRAVTDPTFHAAGVIPRRLDHLLLRLPDNYAVQVQRIEDRYGSDHHPVVGVIRFQ